MLSPASRVDFGRLLSLSYLDSFAGVRRERSMTILLVASVSVLAVAALIASVATYSGR